MAKTNTRTPNYAQVKKYRNDTEATLLTTIQENSQLPKKSSSGISSCGVSVKMKP